MIISKTPYRISFFGGGSDYPAWYKKHGGEVLFDNPNNQVDPSAEVFLVRQSIEGFFFVDETKLYFDGRVIDLDQITVGHFDIEDENVIYWGRL